MYAVVRTGGKQYRVAKNDVIVVEKLEADSGAAVELDEVLAMDDGNGLTVGAPLVDGARVAATVLDQQKGDKIVVFKKNRRKNYRRTRGHRQLQTVLRITDILAKGQKAAAAPKAETAAPKAEPAEPTGDAPAAEAAAPAAAKGKAKAKKAASKGKGKAKAKKAPARDKSDD